MPTPVNRRLIHLDSSAIHSSLLLSVSHNAATAEPYIGQKRGAHGGTEVDKRHVAPVDGVPLGEVVVDLGA